MARASNRNREVRKRGTAREDPATSRGAVGRATDGFPVFADDSGGEVEQRGACVSDRSADGGGSSGGADAVAACVELPVALLRDRCVRKRTSVLR
jgi:hypothetical protein